MAIPLPESMKEPHRIGTLKPTYLVVLAGVEVGIFVSWYVFLTFDLKFLLICQAFL